MASAANALISQNPDAYSPLHEARLEGFGTGAARRKRKDLRFFDSYGRLVLCGEVKLPGTREGSSPYAEKFCQDAEAKANNAGVRYFFTWNVNEFVLWDRSLWDQALLDRRVWRRVLSRHGGFGLNENRHAHILTRVLGFGVRKDVGACRRRGCPDRGNMTI
jgi:hypothetical protein